MYGQNSVAHEALDERLAKHRKQVKWAGEALRAHATRKGSATREKIMTAASEFMVERGSTDFQMSEVSDRCHMSKGSLYYYFKDKNSLVQAIFTRDSDDLLSAVERLVAEAPTAKGALESICNEFGRRLRIGSPLALALVRELSGNDTVALSDANNKLVRTTKIIAAQLERAKAEGAIRSDIDANLAAHFVTGGFLVASLMSVKREFESDGVAGLEDGRELVTKLFDLAMNGIGLQ